MTHIRGAVLSADSVVPPQVLQGAIRSVRMIRLLLERVDGLILSERKCYLGEKKIERTRFVD